ncbi:PREDICTED: TERF1-interacting nuclear factor 2 [Cyprinodon variegatus]|uniref:TERF1 (TRF1)-interacting nuclear factor 2 n=1 Tax=Cyprinodon variegatus TaxID=28743 RepID=A0A3Q2DZG6_CYPVA|nr:PREDICTED: TERF1-interacting nuclear factor 2 [Cyprinodon variegatus]
MAEKKSKENDASLPFAALQLLAPPVRLVSAALWKVLKQRDVMQYGVVEEFVTSACETVPGLLTLRHQGKLALGLRARLILELCLKQPDIDMIAPHLERIRAPAPLLSSSSSTMKRDLKIVKTVESFHAFVKTLLTNQAEKEHFFKEQFPVDYGPKFDQELEKLLWEFLIRLDQLLPVPNLSQTVSWLSDTPPVLEECAQAATQPQLLDILLQHQACLGHLESAASLPPNMGDSILASLSLPPSGKVPSNQPTGVSLSAPERTNGSKPGEAPFIRPVIGLISNDDVPAMISAKKKTLQGAQGSSSNDPTYGQQSPNMKFTLVKQKPQPVEVEQVHEERSPLNPRKRKHPEPAGSDSEEEEISENTPGGKRINRNQRIGDTEEERSHTAQNNGCNRELLNCYINKLGIEKLHLPEDPSLCSMLASCLSSNPRVIVHKLSFSSVSDGLSGGEKKSFNKQKQRKKSSTWKRTPESPGLDDKENRPVVSSGSSSSSRQRDHEETMAVTADDYVADSEDEASKNFKGRLFIKRYYKTKHGTYVPTLREFWKPTMTRPNLLSSASKRR